MRPAMFVLIWLGASVAAVSVAWHGVNFVDDAVIHPASHFDMVRSSSDAIIAAPAETGSAASQPAAVTSRGRAPADAEAGQAGGDGSIADEAQESERSGSEAPLLDLAGDGRFAIPTPTAGPPGAAPTPTPQARAVEPTPAGTSRPTPTPRPRSTVVPRPSPTPRSEATAVPATPSPRSTPRPGATAPPTPRPTATPRPAPSPTPKPSASPTPSPSATAKPSPTAAPAQTLTFTLVGGTTAISFSADSVVVLWASASPGFSADISANSTDVRVEFRADHGDSRIDAWWSNGPQWTIEEDHE